MPPLWVPNWIRASLYWPMRLVIWRQIRPPRMFRGERLPDPQFERSEPIYIRCPSNHLQRTNGGRRLLPTFIRASGYSVNRGKYSLCFDVLLPGAQHGSLEWLYWGVASLQVRDVPSQLQPSTTPTAFRVEHVPDDDNYAHSEIRAYKSERQVADNRVAKMVKKALRQIISDRARILLLPNTSDPNRL